MDKYQIVQKFCADKYGKEVSKGKKDIGDFYYDSNYPINVKSNNVNANNYSPNIISAKKLLQWLSDTDNNFGLIFVDYEIVNDEVIILNETDIIPIEKISWDCLTIEAQGWGVIQKVGELKIVKKQTKKEFFEGFEKAYKKFVLKKRING